MKFSVKILANLVGRIWAAGIAIVLVPFYIKFLGIESYGLVGFYGTILGSMSLLDFGLTLTLNRELTKAIVNKTEASAIRNMVFTIECIYWLVGVSIAILIVCLSPIIASHWIKAEQLPITVIKQAIMLMGVVIAFQWPISLYNGGLLGLEKQVTDNVIMVVMTAVRSGGVILLLWLVGPTLKVFFIWQALSSLLYVLAMRGTLWHYLPHSIEKLKFSKTELKKIWRFAVGMTSISFVAFFLNQIDKIVLSKLLPLSQFAYYMLAFTVANGVTLLVGTVNVTFFPQLTAAVAANDFKKLNLIYHKACRIVAAILFPTGLVIIFFAKEILFIWTRNTTTVENTSLMVQILVAGTICGNLMGIPYILMLAKGETKFPFYQNLLSAIIIVPLLFLFINLFGATGGTLTWLCLNLGYLIIGIPLVHRRFLPGELKNWYIKDMLLPLIAPLSIVIILKIIFLKYMPNLNIPFLALISFITLLSSLILLPEALVFIKQKFNKAI